MPSFALEVIETSSRFVHNGEQKATNFDDFKLRALNKSCQHCCLCGTARYCAMGGITWRLLTEAYINVTRQTWAIYIPGSTYAYTF